MTCSRREWRVWSWTVSAILPRKEIYRPRRSASCRFPRSHYPELHALLLQELFRVPSLQVGERG